MNYYKLLGLILVFIVFISCKTDNTTTPPVDVETTPEIISINISTLKIGDKFSIRGKNFGSTQGSTKVLMNSVEVSQFTLWSDSLITCTVPNGVSSGKLKIIKSTKTSNEISYTIQQIYTTVPMVLIPAGNFIMGSDKSTDIDNDINHKVTISKEFYMSKFEIRQLDWKLVYGSVSNPSKYVGDSLPVDQVEWIRAVKFCNELSKIEKLTQCYTINGDVVTCNWTANGYRLPTEAEWEYACRAGTTTDLYGNINEIGWTNLNSGSTSHNVGQKKPNNFGLYDMSGNVYEWCWDYYDADYYGMSPEIDPKGPNSGEERVLRSGSWIDGEQKAKSITRNSAIPSLYNYNWGFRVVRNK